MKAIQKLVILITIFFLYKICMTGFVYIHNGVQERFSNIHGFFYAITDTPLSSAGTDGVTTSQSQQISPQTYPVEKREGKIYQHSNTHGKAFIQYYEKFCANTDRNFNRNGTGIKALCPCWSDKLEGKLNFSILPSATQVLFTDKTQLKLSPGGSWQPTQCTPRQNVAIIIPYRDRESHLMSFLHHYHPILQSQLLKYRIFVVEQAKTKTFNKAALMNIGFLEAVKLDTYDCIIFHDVDIFLEDDRNLYICVPDKSSVTHLAPYIDTFNYTIKFAMSGASLAFTPEQFIQVNGFSNHYWGWGGEDDDMRNRIKAAKLAMKRPPAEFARYRGLKHQPDIGNPVNRNRAIAYKYRPELYIKDGLTEFSQNLYYKENLQNLPMFTWVHVALNYTD